MRIHHGVFLSLATALVLTLAGCASTGTYPAATTGMLAADAPRALPDSGPVSVHWSDPANFTEIRQSGNRSAASQGNWLEELAQYMRKRAQPLMAPGEHLDITILDIQRAGRYEPWRGPELQNVRVITYLYPPWMTVQFIRYDPSGAVVAEGERKLTDQSFLINSSPVNDTDPLRYEKRMIDDWLRREFAPDKR